MRVAMHPILRIGNSHGVEHFDRLLHRLSASHSTMSHQHLSHLGADLEIGIERGHRILKNHSDMGAADAVHDPLTRTNKLLVLESNRACDLSVGRQQPHDRQRSLTLTGARFTHNAQGGTGIQLEAQAVDGIHHAVFRREPYTQVVDRQKHGLPILGVQGIAQPVPDEVEAEQRDGQEARRECQRPPG